MKENAKFSNIFENFYKLIEQLRKMKNLQ